MGSKKNKGNNGPEKFSPEYREKRMKNNVAVKRSRDKSKQKAREAQVRVQQLQMENDQLQTTVDSMTSELRYLKELLISQAGTSEYLSPDTAADLEDLLQEDCPRDLGKLTMVLNEMKRIQSLQKGGVVDPMAQQGYHSSTMYQQGQGDHGVMYQPNGSVFDPNSYL